MCRGRYSDELETSGDFESTATAKARNESSARGSFVTHESATVSEVRSVALDGSSGITTGTYIY